MSLGKVGLYGCGGFGINTVRPWDLSLEANAGAAQKVAGHADIKVTYVDTSRRNLLGDEKEENIYLASGIDGAGKLRRDSHTAFAEENAVQQILVAHPPEAINIVSFSLSGGSGNTVGTGLIEAMLKAGHRVIAVIVGSCENALTMKNSIDSLVTLDGKSRKLGAPFVVAYEDNGDNSERAAVDERVKAIIASLVVLAGPKVRELDSADVTNWLRYDRIPGVNIAPQLSLLEIVSDAAELSDIADPISIASIISDPSETLKGLTPDYSTVGYHAEGTIGAPSYHYVISVDAVAGLAGMLRERQAEVEKRRQARKTTQAITSDSDVVGDDGYAF